MKVSFILTSIWKSADCGASSATALAFLNPFPDIVLSFIKLIRHLKTLQKTIAKIKIFKYIYIPNILAIHDNIQPKFNPQTKEFFSTVQLLTSDTENGARRTALANSIN